MVYLFILFLDFHCVLEKRDGKNLPNSPHQGECMVPNRTQVNEQKDEECPFQRRSSQEFIIMISVTNDGEKEEQENQ